jgi:hypothetical protein
MLRKLCLFFLFGWSSVGISNAQLVREFRTPEKTGFELVHLDFSTYKSETTLKRIKSSEPINIHGHLAKTNVLPVFSHQIRGNVLETTLVHKNIESENLGKSIASKLLSSGESGFDHSWDLGLSSNFLYSLDFNLGMGIAKFDLSVLPIAQLKVKSSSADVFIQYSSKDPNQIQMDTLLVILNMGSLGITNANFTNAKTMIFEVNYGSINLDFSEGMPSKCNVIAAVGAGTLNLNLPPDSFPIKLKMNTTAMCRTSLPKYLKALDANTYVTKGYKSSDPRLLELTVDVGVGSLSVE